MAHFKANFAQHTDEVLHRAADALALDADFAVMCAVLRSGPKFGYGPIEAQVDVSGHLEVLTYGLAPCACITDE